MSRIFASAVGAFVACILSLQFGGGFLVNIISLIAGGVVAWIGYDIPGLFRGIARAFRETLRGVARIDVKKASWAIAGAVCSSTVISSFLFAVLLITLRNGASNDTLVIGILILSIYFGAAPILMLLSYYSHTKDELRTIALRDWGYFFMIGNPISFTVVIVLLVLRLLFHIPGALLTGAQTAFEMMMVFVPLVFAFTHNEQRKLSFISAVIGGVIGIYFKNPAIGALTGGLIGWLYAPLTLGSAQRIMEQHKLEYTKLRANR
jgi:hypothetical protein